MTKKTKKRVEKFLPILREKIKEIKGTHVCKEIFIKEAGSKKVVSICFERLIQEKILRRDNYSYWKGFEYDWKPNFYEIVKPKRIILIRAEPNYGQYYF